MLEPLLDVQRLIEALDDQRVRFVLIGGLAVNVHGSARLTLDFDAVYARSPENLAAIVAALAPLGPQLRTAHGPVPFRWDTRALKSGLNFTLVTDAGSVDLLGEAAGVTSFEDLWANASEVPLYGRTVRVASIRDLIAMKKAAGRGKDLLDLHELEQLERLHAEPED